MLDAHKPFPGFSVDDLSRAKQFYGDTLGLHVEESEGMLELDLGPDNHVLVYSKDNHQPATFTVLNFPVDDIERAVEQLTESGVQLEHYEQEDIKTDERGIHRGNGGPSIAWFRDPAGNILSVLET
jgi:catechol 2,3-dioxygenase-like lactoylglutathione lyase family enzyme